MHHDISHTTMHAYLRIYIPAASVPYTVFTIQTHTCGHASNIYLQAISNCTIRSHIMSRSRSRLRSRSITHQGLFSYIQPCTYIPLLSYYVLRCHPCYDTAHAQHLRTLHCCLNERRDRLHIYLFLRRLRLLMGRRCLFRAACHFWKRELYI